MERHLLRAPEKTVVKTESNVADFRCIQGGREIVNVRVEGAMRCVLGRTVRVQTN